MSDYLLNDIPTPGEVCLGSSLRALLLPPLIKTCYLGMAKCPESFI